MAEALPAISRPNGKPYRPRELVACAVTDTAYDELAGVVVLGTHDPGTAQALADNYVQWQLGSRHRAVDPVLVWWRDGFSGGSRAWVTDEIHGRAGVWFREIVEVPRA